jgi:hypothetical protein
MEIAFGAKEGQIDKAIKGSLEAAIRMIADSFASDPDAADQVGFDIAQFRQNISKVYALGPHEFGIIDTDVLGGEEEIEEIFGLPNFWHQGTGSFDLFFAYIQDPANKADLASRRRAVWGSKTPQWIYLEYGTSATLEPFAFLEADVTQEAFGSIQTSVFQVEVPPGGHITKARPFTAQKVTYEVLKATNQIVRDPAGRFAKK